MNLVWKVLRWDPPAELAPESWPTGIGGLTRALRDYWGLFLSSVIAALFNHGSNLATAMLGAYVIGRAVDGTPWRELTPYAWALGILVVVRAAFAFVEIWLAHDLAYRLLAVMRHWIYWGVERIAPGGLIKRRSGDLTAAAMQDAEKLESFYAHVLLETFVVVFLPVACLIVLITLHWWFAAILLPTLLLMLLIPAWLMRLANRQGSEVRALTGAVQSEIVDDVTGLREVILFGRQADWLDRLDRAGERLTRSQIKFGVRAGAEAAASNSLAAAGILATLIVSTILVDDGRLSAGLAPMVVTVFAFAVATVARYIQIVSNHQGQVFGSADRIFSLLNAERPVEERSDLQRPPVAPIGVRFRNVTFRYNQDTPEAVCDVSFTIAPGTTTAIVGHSGSGKSTCAYLLMRFWDCESGAIEVGDVDIRDLAVEALRDLIGYVPQDPFLFHDTIANNIRIARPDATDDEVRAVARAAQADNFIRHMPDGYETVTGDRGSRLSGGERQRIAIARALLKNSPVLVMDEPTSQLDAFTEREMREAIDRAREGRTVVVIAHRLATIQSADQIIVLDRGIIVERGTHESLLDAGGHYARLVSIQREGIMSGGVE